MRIYMTRPGNQRRGIVVSSIIHLEFIKDPESEDYFRKSYTPATFHQAVGELEQLVKDPRTRIRLVLADTSDVLYTMLFIKSASVLLYDHLMESIPADKIQSSLIKQHDAIDADAPFRSRLLRYLKYNRLKTFLLLVCLVGVGLALVVPDDTKRIWQKIYYSRVKIYGHASLPIESGWILLGHYNDYNQRFADGPFAIIIKSPHGEKGVDVRAGDVIVITKTLGIVIVDYKTDGKGKIHEPPWRSGSVGSNDQTGIEITAGHKLKVLEVGFGRTDTHLREIWARVADTDE